MTCCKDNIYSDDLGEQAILSRCRNPESQASGQANMQTAVRRTHVLVLARCATALWGGALGERLRSRPTWPKITPPYWPEMPPPLTEPALLNWVTYLQCQQNLKSGVAPLLTRSGHSAGLDT